MYTYQLTAYSSVVRSDGLNIPADPANSDYVTYLAWLADGNTATPVSPLTPSEQNAPILTQITQLEGGQSRAVREAALGIAGAVPKLQTLNNQIAGLRKQLVS